MLFQYYFKHTDNTLVKDYLDNFSGMKNEEYLQKYYEYVKKKENNTPTELPDKAFSSFESWEHCIQQMLKGIRVDSIKNNERLKEAEEVFDNNYLKWNSFHSFISANVQAPKSCAALLNNRCLGVGVENFFIQSNSPFWCALYVVD